MMSVDTTTLEKIQSNAKAIAHRYRRRCWWVPVDDIVQEATRAQLEAVKNYDPERGPELGAYLWYAALYSARRLVHKLSAPVTHSHRVEKLRHLTRTTLMIPGTNEDGSEASYDRPELVEHDTPEAITHRVSVAAKVQARAFALLGVDGARFAFSVIGGEFCAKDIVAVHGGEASEVYAATAQLRAVLSNDQELYELWRES
jgi:hypothetical protein